MSRLRGQFGELDRRRNLDDECGYETDPTAERLLELFVKDAYANRVCQVWPAECFQVFPSIYETEADRETAFEKAFDEMCSQYGGGLGLLQGDQGSMLWGDVKNADVLSGIGSYGCILIGIDDDKPMSEPADLKSKKERRLNYLRPLPEPMARVNRLNSDPQSPRYGQPEEYNVTLMDSSTMLSGSGMVVGSSIKSEVVHWTRIHHLAENLLTSRTFAEPRMRPVLPQIQNLRKVAGGSAEMFWKGGFPGIFFGTHPALGGDVTLDTESIKDQMENWENSLQRWLAGPGMTAQVLSPNVADPMNHVLIQIEGICINLTMPKRIFMGSERGELASSQDDAAWNDRVKGRQIGYLTPRVIVPLIERLIMLGVLPVPKRLFVEWPDVTSQTPMDRMLLAEKKITTVSAYIAGGADAMIPPKTLLADELGYSDEKADEMLEEAEKLAQEAQEDQQAMFEEQGLGPDGQPLLPEPGAEGEGGIPPAGTPQAGGGGEAAAPEAEPEEEDDGSFAWLDDEEEEEKPKKKAVKNTLLFSGGGERAKGKRTENAFDVSLGRKSTTNAFCPTGKGGGSDNSCGKGEGAAVIPTKEEKSAANFVIRWSLTPGANVPQVDPPPSVVKVLAKSRPKEPVELTRWERVDHDPLKSDMSSKVALQSWTKMDRQTAKESIDEVNADADAKGGQKFKLISRTFQPNEIMVDFTNLSPGVKAELKRRGHDADDVSGLEEVLVNYSRELHKRGSSPYFGRNVKNAFCPTGKGRGRDNSCGRGSLARMFAAPNPAKMFKVGAVGGVSAEVAALPKVVHDFKAAAQGLADRKEGQIQARLDAVKSSRQLYFKRDATVGEVNDWVNKLHVHDRVTLTAIAQDVNLRVPDKVTRTDVISALSAKFVAKFGPMHTWYRKAAGGGHVVRSLKDRRKAEFRKPKWKVGRKMKVAVMKPKENAENCRVGGVNPGPCPELGAADVKSPRGRKAIPVKTTPSAKQEHDAGTVALAKTLGMTPEALTKKYPAMATKPEAKSAVEALKPEKAKPKTEAPAPDQKKESPKTEVKTSTDKINVSGMKKIGEGAARTVYDDGDTVVKVAKSARTKKDNKVEAEISGKSELFAKIKESAKDGSWVRQEKLESTDAVKLADKFGVSKVDREAKHTVTIKDPWGLDQEIHGKDWMFAATHAANGSKVEGLGKSAQGYVDVLKKLKQDVPQIDLTDLAYPHQWGVSKDGKPKIADFSWTDQTNQGRKK